MKKLLFTLSLLAVPGVAMAQSTGGGAGATQQNTLLNSILTGVTSPLVPPSGTPTETSVTCGTSSTTLLAASTATQFVMVQVPPGNGSVWINFAGSAAVTSNPSVNVPSGGSIMWSAMNYLPTTQINCIGAASSAVTLMYK